MTNKPRTGLLLLRHGESFWNANKKHLIGGRSNQTRLTPTGHRQTANVGERLLEAGIVPTHVHSSTAVRTIESIGNALTAMRSDAEVFTDPALQELSQGEWEGLLREACYTPEVRQEVQRLGLDFKAPGGESMREVGERIAAWVGRTIAIDPDVPELHLVSAHGVATRSYVARQEGWTHSEIMANTLGNATMTLMVPHDGQWRLEYFGQDRPCPIVM
ncbi:MAG TPA: histidine phosphatase family protein [Candidatus Saccharimonadales bacterium]|nr:histidine phosphatase family protein [Candidatus Saccharimonadales bacterium]